MSFHAVATFIFIYICRNASASGGFRPQSPYLGSAPGTRWGLSFTRSPDWLPPGMFMFSPRMLGC